METKLDKKVVVITGGAGGIGSELVRHFHKAGARVAIHYRSNKEGAESVASELALNPEAHCYKADLTNESDVRSMFHNISQKLGTAEILIANAGTYVSDDIPLYKMSLSQWNETLNNNLTSMFLSIREFLIGIEKAKIIDPSIVLIGSTAGTIGEANHSDYAASKSAGIYGLMKSLKNEIPRIAPLGRINAICPSWTLTPMAEDFASEGEGVLKHLQTTSLRRIARTTDVAHSALFLASAQLSGHMTGQIIELSGGLEGRVLYNQSEISLENA